MAIRVYKLAKELGVTSKDIMSEAMNHGIEVQNHMGSLTEAQANLIRAFLITAPAKTDAAAEPEADEAPNKPSARRMPPSKRKSQEDKGEAGDATADAEDKAAAEPEKAPAPTAPTAPPPSMREMKPIRPPSSEPKEAAPAARRDEEQPVAPAETPAAEPEKVAAPSTPELQLNKASVRILNRGEEDEAGDAEGAESDDDEVAAEPREMRVAAPGDAQVMKTKSVDSIDDKPTKELPKRRQATILGRKELPPQQRGGQGDRGGDRGAPVFTGGEDMIQTNKEGTRRTFVPRGGGPGGPGRGRGGPRGGGGAGGGFGGRGGGFGGRGGNRGGNFPMRPSKKNKAPIERPSSIEIQLPITVKDLSAAMALKSNLIIEQLIKNHGMFPSINTMLEKETVELIGIEFECEINVLEKNLEKEFAQDEVEAWEVDESNVVPRAPIVTFLGHVDHGKTSLLDYIRKTRVAEREAGGITQHTGAYRVKTKSGAVVFLDTPGHKAFTEMRARGANVTDLVVLVVAANDGVMPQTEEAIAHAQAADTPVVVAINKIDRADANVMQVKQQLSGLGLQPEDWGGDTVCVEVSAVTGQGVDDLIEYLGLVSEMLELTADPTRPAVGTVIESLQKKGEGNVARIVVTDGTMRRGDTFLCGHVFGKIKSMRLPDGKPVKEVGPAFPVEITGLAELPAAGDRIFVVQDERKAKQLAEERQARIRDERLVQRQHTNLENLLKQANTGSFNLILKTDTVGSLEVLKKEILDLAHDEVEPKIILSGVGGVTDTDVTLADASDAIIIGFHVTDSATARRLAEEKGVEIRHYSVIYNLLDEIKQAMEGQLAPEVRETITGHLEVLKTFKVSRVGTIAGCLVQDGLIRRTARVRITRDGILIHEGKLASLRHLKDDVKEVKDGSECGVRVDGFDDVKVGDVLEPYEIEHIKRSLDD